jgi:hypothetical protein
MDNDWTKVLGFPGYRVYKHEIDEQRKHLDFLWKFPKDRLENGIKITKQLTRDLRCLVASCSQQVARPAAERPKSDIHSVDGVSRESSRPTHGN